MPAKHHIDNKARLIITTWEGEATDIDFIEAVRKYQKDIQTNPDYINYNEVVDFRKITNIKLTTTGLKNIGKLASKTDKNKNKSKLVFIVGSNKAFFFARMYQAIRSFSRNSNKEIRIFNEESEAYDWVQNNT